MPELRDSDIMLQSGSDHTVALRDRDLGNPSPRATAARAASWPPKARGPE